MIDFIELGLDKKHKIKIYISSTYKKQTTMHSGKQTKPLILFNEFYDKTHIRDNNTIKNEQLITDTHTRLTALFLITDSI